MSFAGKCTLAAPQVGVARPAERSHGRNRLSDSNVRAKTIDLGLGVSSVLATEPARKYPGRRGCAAGDVMRVMRIPLGGVDNGDMFVGVCECRRRRSAVPGCATLRRESHNRDLGRSARPGQVMVKATALARCLAAKPAPNRRRSQVRDRWASGPRLVAGRVRGRLATGNWPAWTVRGARDIKSMALSV